MVKTYNSIRNDDGNLVNGRTKLFISKVDETGNIEGYFSGVAIVPENEGLLFIVDDWLIKQVGKLNVVGGQLIVKDGEKIDEPVLTDLEKQELELEKQLAALRAKKEKNNIE